MTKNRKDEKLEDIRFVVVTTGLLGRNVFTINTLHNIEAL